MAVYLITYDLNKETTRPPIVKEIKDNFDWAQFSESSYAVSTTRSVDSVYEQISKHIDEDDALYVISLTHPYKCWGPESVNEWLDKHL